VPVTARGHCPPEVDSKAPFSSEMQNSWFCPLNSINDGGALLLREWLFIDKIGVDYMKNYSITFFLILLVVFYLAGCSDDEEEVVVSGGGNGTTPPVVNHSNDPPKVEDPTKIPVIEVPRDGGTAPGGPFPQGDQTSGLDDAVEQNAVIFLLEEYLVNFEKAVNDGAFVYISHLLDPESQLYEEQIDYVLDMYERQITEKIIQYQIGTPVKLEEDTYEVTVQETYSIHYGIEGREEFKNFENTYTVIRYDVNVWLIHDLNVTVVE
jgi:uncharacterized lipoprotein YehR (DUF1307 family)